MRNISECEFEFDEQTGYIRYWLDEEHSEKQNKENNSINDFEINNIKSFDFLS